MIRLLDINDTSLYLSHLQRVIHTKGIRSIKNPDECDLISKQIYNIGYVNDMLNNKDKLVWGEISPIGEIISSVQIHKFTAEPLVYISNFKNESELFFNPEHNILKFLDLIFNFFAKQGIFKFLIIRPFELFNSRRYKFVEDKSPLNKFNCYFVDIIKANTLSKWPLYRNLLHNKTYDIDLVVVSMELKQQLRTYAGKTIYPLKESKQN